MDKMGRRKKVMMDGERREEISKTYSEFDEAKDEHSSKATKIRIGQEATKKRQKEDSSNKVGNNVC